MEGERYLSGVALGIPTISTYIPIRMGGMRRNEMENGNLKRLLDSPCPKHPAGIHDLNVDRHQRQYCSLCGGRR